MSTDEPNYFDYAAFYDFIADQPFETFVEVGCWLGHSTSYLARRVQHKPNAKIYAVDLFDDSYAMRTHPNLDGIRYSTFAKNINAAGVSVVVIPICAVSWEAAHNFADNSVDFVFIDADHSEAAVTKDINAWLPKVKTGGILAGHDYGNGNSGVKSAVDARFSDFKRFGSSCWYVHR